MHSVSDMNFMLCQGRWKKVETVLSINYINDISTYKDIQIIQLCNLFRLFPGAAFLSKRREEEVCNSSIKIKAKNIYNYLSFIEKYLISFNICLINH